MGSSALPGDFPAWAYLWKIVLAGQFKGGGIAYVPTEERQEYELGKPVPTDVQSKWEKMSKSKGNIIDPLEIIEKYGTDAMRMAFCASATQAREIDLDQTPL